MKDKNTEIIIRKYATGELAAELVRSNRKSVALQVYGDERVVVRAPKRITKREVIRFLDEHEEWIRTKQDELSMRAKRRQEQQNRYEIPAYKSLSSAEKNRIRAHFLERITLYAEKMGVTCQRVTIRNQKGRWGSCSSKGNLNFNYRLHYLPQELMDYVIVHELSHRVYMNHSRAFWALVERYMPDYKTCRKRLREIGIM